MSWAIWISGRPGSGTSAVTREAAAQLRAAGRDVAVLELDELREAWTPAPTYSDGEREIVYAALAELAARLVASGVPVLIDATAHRRAWRDRARALVPSFAEVQLECPVEVCREREAVRHGTHASSGIHARAGRPRARGPGADVPYEPPRSPDLVLDTVALDVEHAAAHVVALAEGLSRASLPSRRPAGRGGVLWISGRPGSGKTTLARGVADRLRAAGVEPAVLDLRGLRHTLIGDRFAREDEEAMVYRILASFARILVERGVAVIVDAMTPRRSWRELARRSIPAFAEVQLVCPPDVCAAREREARWHLGGGPGVSGVERGRRRIAGAGDLPRLRGVAGRGADPSHARGRTLERGRPDDPPGVAAPPHRPRGSPRGRTEAEMLVSELMAADPVTVSPDTPVFEARQRMLQERIRHLPVTERGQLVGIVTDRDIRLNLPSQATSLSVWEVNYLLARLTVEKVMTRTVITVGPDRDAGDAARLMLEHRIGGLPVMDAGRVVGILTETDIVRAFVKTVAPRGTRPA
jgi:adenylylsulfate kinase-like enzyme/CBS domain-containing protein